MYWELDLVNTMINFTVICINVCMCVMCINMQCTCVSVCVFVNTEKTKSLNYLHLGWWKNHIIYIKSTILRYPQVYLQGARKTSYISMFYSQIGVKSEAWQSLRLKASWYPGAFLKHDEESCTEGQRTPWNIFQKGEKGLGNLWFLTVPEIFTCIHMNMPMWNVSAYFSNCSMLS